MADYIERQAAIKKIRYKEKTYGCVGATYSKTIKSIPSADVAPVVHGEIIWKERHRGGFETVKCLHCFNSSIMENNIPCKHIAKIDGRYTIKEPYCSKCGKLLGDFLNYCGNCGAKMDGDKNADLP